MNLKNKLVAHRKVHILHLTSIEMSGSKGDIIDFGTVEIALVKSAINKSNPNKSSGRKFTMIENTPLKISIIEVALGISKATKRLL